MGSISENDAAPSTDIDTIDISPLLSATASKNSHDAVLEALRLSCTSTGFFQIIGHGIPLSLQQQVLDCAKRFFDLPLEQKNEVALSKAFGHAYRGYEEMKGQTSSQGSPPDLKEGFICDREIPETDPRAGNFLWGPNQWPAALGTRDFGIPLLEYRAQVVKVVETLLRATTTILADRLPENIFDGFTTEVTAPLRLLHYPPQASEDKTQFGTGPHADVSCLTVLLQQPGTAGLEIWAEPKGTWVPVPVIEDALVVNVGDMLQGWTGGYFRSAKHRVINAGTQDRYSAPLFYMGNLDAQFTPLQNTSKATENSAWDNAGMTDKPTTVGKFLMSRLQAVNSGDSGKAVS